MCAFDDWGSFWLQESFSFISLNIIFPVFSIRYGSHSYSGNLFHFWNLLTHFISFSSCPSFRENFPRMVSTLLVSFPGAEILFFIVSKLHLILREIHPFQNISFIYFYLLYFNLPFHLNLSIYCIIFCLLVDRSKQFPEILFRIQTQLIVCRVCTLLKTLPLTLDLNISILMLYNLEKIRLS